MASRKRQTEINEPIKAKKAKKETAGTSKTSKVKIYYLCKIILKC